MRRRLLLATLSVAVTAVLLFGIPLAIVESRLQVNAARQQVQRDATTVARTLQGRHDARLPTNLSDVVNAARSLPDRYISIKSTRHQPISFGQRLPASRSIQASAATRNFSVTVEADDAVADAGVTNALALIGSLAVVAVSVAVLLAVLQARRLTRPMEELAYAAERLGSGDARPLGRRYGVPELDQVAEGLDGSAQRITDLLAAEREFAADASHQLRTPLTALSMRLEEMLAAADEPDVVREEGAAALGQTERLAEVVSQLLGRSRRSSGSVPELSCIDDVVAQQVVEWDPAFRRRNRKLELAGEKGLRAYATRGNLAQVVATLLDNALVHGGGTVTIRTSRTPKSVVVEVRDQGRGVPAELAARIFERTVSGEPGGTGLGLALARSVAEADGGKVVLVRPRPAVFAIFLPRGQEEAEEPVVTGPA
ncbi:MAG: HAMP domain-containing histidine kinase [Nocardiopsaceae bacterium]|jgi:signal transduction histidine kinase|nr:HAMP domain-containing histidine kinase [Nocardiopsaceae bacterium]